MNFGERLAINQKTVDEVLKVTVKVGLGLRLWLAPLLLAVAELN